MNTALVSASCLAALAATVGSMAIGPANTARDPRAQAQPAPTLTLRRIMEVRAADVAIPPDGADVMAFSSDQPGLRLTFTLNLPPGLRLMNVAQPTEVKAVDSAGTDLAKVEPGFRDEIEFIDIGHDFDEEDQQSEITLQLTPAARSATTFDAAAAFTATVYTGMKDVAMDVTSEWTPLTSTEPGLKDARIRAGEDGLELKPAETEEWIDSLQVQVGEREAVEANGWFSDGETLTYMLEDLPEARPLKVRFKVRTGVQTLPLTIDIKKQPLP
jgi:hypothetical protein